MFFKRKPKGPPLKASELKKLISTHIAPRLRELGWKGSGMHYKKINGNSPIIQVIGFQVNKYGGEFCVEVGIHPNYLPERWEGQYELKKLTHASLLIRSRLSPKMGSDYWWKIGADEKSTLKILDNVWETFKKNGIPYFGFYEEFPQPFTDVKIIDGKLKTPIEFATQLTHVTDITLCWLVAHSFDYIKDYENSYRFSHHGINCIHGRQGIALKSGFEELMKKKSA
ncbi:MAG: DUF4304 domain-containing protein [Bacteroidota bacterium]